MKRRRWKPTLVAALATSAAALASGNYSWDGLGAPDYDWDNGNNWAVDNTATAPYPDDEYVNATVPVKSGDPWTIKLIDETIGPLAVSGSTNFGSVDGNDRVMNVATLTLSGDNNGITVTIGNHGIIRTY
jgi:hypothetical protein